MLRLRAPLAALFALGCGLGGSGSSMEATRVALGSVAAPTPAGLFVVRYRRDATTPWSRALTLELQGVAREVDCGDAGPLPTGPFADAIVEEPSGDRLAYRCGPGRPWRIMYLAASDAWLSCETGRSGAAIAWAAVPDIQSAAPALARCEGLDRRALGAYRRATLEQACACHDGE